MPKTFVETMFGTISTDANLIKVTDTGNLITDPSHY